MRAWVTYILGVLTVLVGIWAMDYVLPQEWEWVSTALYAVVIVSSGLGAMVVRTRLERVSRSANEGSLEREVAQKAAAGTLGTVLVAIVGFGLFLVVREEFLYGAVLYLLVVLVMCAYWMRYAHIRRQLT